MSDENYKNYLIGEAFEVNKLLDQYIAIHNKRLKTAGTFISLFRNLVKKIDFQELYSEIDAVYQEFDEKKFELMAMKERYEDFTQDQKNFYDQLMKYFTALFEAVGLLHSLAYKQNELSKGLGKGQLTLSEDLQIEKEYKEKCELYYSYGADLNALFDKMKYSD